MIEPGELHKYFAVREMATGREVWLMNGDVRYAETGDRFCGHYRIAPGGTYFLVRLGNAPSGIPGFLLTPDEAEPLPDGKGVCAVPDELKLTMTYEGSWRQHADQEARTAA